MFGNTNAVRNVGHGAFGNAVQNDGHGTFSNAILNCKFDFFCGKTYCRGGSRLNRPYKYLFVGAAGTTAAPTNRFVGAAGQTAPTNGLQTPLEMLFDIVLIGRLESIA